MKLQDKTTSAEILRFFSWHGKIQAATISALYKMFQEQTGHECAYITFHMRLKWLILEGCIKERIRPGGIKEWRLTRKGRKVIDEMMEVSEE